MEELFALGTGAPLDYDLNETFIDAFLRQVEKTPDATAVVDEYGSITYRELDRRSDHIAAELQKMGVGTGDFVAIKLPRVKEFLVAVLGIWKAGEAYMPVDPTYPEERIRYMLEDSEAKVTIDESWMERLRSASTVPVNNARPDGIAIIIYTSGSTGRPKGVLNTHRAVRALCYGMTVMYDYRQGDKVAQVPSFSFVISVADLFPPLTFGIPVYILPVSLLVDIPALDRYIRENGISSVSIVPQIGHTLVESFHTPLKAIGMGGSDVPFSGKSSTRLYSVYGLTELCAGVSCIELTELSGGDKSLLGCPLPGVTMALEDEDGNLVPRGEIGEVCIASPQVAAGYWHNEELTEKVFVRRPWSEFRVFRSGDLARWNEDGVLEFHGRSDDMVKIRGNRVELREVESAMLKFNGILSGAVAMKEVGGESMLCGYYVSSEPVSSDFLRASMSEFLPPYMIPSFFVRVDALPKLPNGKLDRLSLPVPDMEASRETVAPQSGFERKVFPIVAREVGTENFGVTTNLISLGLTSLRAIRLSAVLKSELGLDIPQAEMLAHPSIREWEALSRTESDTVSVEAPRGFYPLTDSQTGIYVEWEQNRESDCYNLPSVIKIADGDALKLFDCVKEAVAKYPILKMHITGQDGTVVQMRRDDAQLTVGFEHLGFEPDEDFFRKLVRPFNLSGGDLARFNVYSSPQAAWLFFDVHHIIFDGGSANVFMKTLSSIYGGRAVPSETVTLYDYALYRENRNSGKAYEESGRYYEALLEGTESFRYPSSSGRSADGRMGLFSMTLSRPSVRAFCHQCGVTENSFFATVLTQVFHRVSREGIIQMAMFSSGRSMTELSGSIGMFVRTLPLVSRSSEGSVRSILQEMHRQIVETISHDQYPYITLSERFGIQPDVMYVYQGDLLDDIAFAGVSPVWKRLPVSAAISPLSIEIEPSGDEYMLKFEYDSGLYEENEISLLAHSVRTLAAAMAGSSSDAPVNGLPMVPQDEMSSIISLGTGPGVGYDRGETFVDMFLRNVSAAPDAVAVVDFCSSLTYGELDVASDALASRLISEGVQAGDFVAVKIPRVKEFVVAVTGIWKAGAAYVPVDPEYPSERISYMLEDSGAKVVIDLSYCDSIAGGNTEPLNLARPENPAYMIYTSGSTGKPKGVVVSHANLRAFLAWIMPLLSLRNGDAVAEYVSFSFDGSIADLYPPLSSGASVHILSSELRRDMAGMDTYFRENHIKGLVLISQIGAEMLNTFDLSLEYLLIGGERVPQFRPCGVRVINVYGPTECTDITVCGVVDQSFPLESVPIGRPVPNTVCLVSDAYGNILPRGMAGELCLGGSQVSNGYWHRPELTSEVFVPCKALGGATIYRTGDLVRWNENGELECLGRIDHQVKLRGFRIEMGEIESALSKFEGITSAVAEVKTVNGIQHLCAYYVADAPIEEDALKSELSKSLTEYMIPDTFMRLESLPLTPGGKVDRKALPLPEIKGTVYVAPTNGTEQTIADAFRESLNLSAPIGIEDGFYALGGDSIKAIRVVSRLRQNGLTLTVAQIIKLQTVKALAEVVETTDEGEDFSGYFEMMPLPVEESFSSFEEYESIRDEFERRGETIERAYPLTSMQEGMLLTAISEPESSAYHITFRMSLGILPTETQLSYALEKLLSKREVLRTAIIYDGVSEPRQAIIAGRKLPLIFVDLSSEGDIDAAAQVYDRREFDRKINLQWDSLFRCTCIKTGENSCHLLFAAHHAIIDGWCNALWTGDFFTYLTEAVTGRESEEDFSEGHGRYERHVCGILMRDREDALNYWKELLSNYGTKAEIPAYGKVTERNRSSENEIKVSLSADTTGKLQNICRENGCTVNNAVEAAWGLVLQVYNRTDDAVFVKVVSGRDNSQEDMSDVLGLFINSVPVRVRCGENDTIMDVIKGCQRQAAETSGNDWVPLSAIQQQSPLGSNLFQSILAFENFGTGDMSAVSEEDVLKAGIISVHETNISEITIVAYISGESLELGIKYDVEKYAAVSIERVIGVFRNILSQMADSPSMKVSSLLLTDDDATRELISLGIGEKLDYDHNETFVDQFLHSVRQYPDSVAVVDAGSLITYRELNEKSNILAARLIELGVRKDTFVAVMLPRVKEFVVAVLSVWKAGGAYLPLGSEYPKERLKFMLEDAEAGIMITESGIWSEMSGAGLPAKTVLKLDEFDFRGSAAPVNNAVADGLAYMIYTSGSTGKPKGTMLEHRNLRAFNQWLVRSGEIGAGDAISVHASFSFDGSCLDLYPALTVGGQVHILSKEVREDMSLMDKYFRENHIKGCFLTARLAGELLNSFDLSLDYLMAGGEKVVPFRPCGVRVMNAYGPTECTILSTCGPIDQSFPEENIPLGRPVPNTYAVIVDACGNMVPRGMAGELCLCGPQIARGYWKRPELTAEKFCGCPFYPGERMYHTGDIAFWNEKGELVCLGRTDDQIKLRGFRIELGEIEAAMSSYPGILSAVSDVRTINGISHLCAWYVSKDEIDESSLRVFLSDYLTDYMVPESFVRMEKMPMTANMKVDRKALPNPELKADEIVAPETERERQLLEVVSEELGTDQFGVTTNLLSMGLTSIRAIRLSMVIKNRLGLSISTGDILSRPRIRDWQESVSETIEVAGLREHYPLTDNQLGIYIDWERHRDGLQYNVPSAMKFIGADADRMATALRKVISNHPSLKTRIIQVEEDVMQRRRDDAEIPVLFEHLEEEPSAAFFQSRVRPFNLLEDDLARFEVYQTETAAYLFYDIHHIIFDGGAANVLLSDLTKILSGTGIEPEKVSAFDYALYYDDWKRSDKYVEYGKYFDGLVSDTESFLYPVGSTGQSSEGESATLAVSVPLDKIRSFCRSLGITENAYFATVLTQVFHRISREDSILITTISNGRSMEQLSETMGMFVQTLPLVSRSSRGTVSDILRDMQSQIVETVRRDKYPFTRLSERHGIRPNVLYAYQGDVMDSDVLSGERIHLKLDTAKMPLSLNVFPSGENYSLLLEYDEGRYSAKDMALLGDVLSVFALSLAESAPESDISSVGIAAPSEVEPLIVLGSGVKLGYDSSETFVDMFLRNVSAAPDAVAVVDFCSSLTYSELDRASDALASRLVSEEVQAGDFVAVKMPRVKEFVVAVLGIWKAGAAYVPVDPEYPSERISYMLEDSGAKVVIDSRYCDSIAGGNTKPLNLARPENPAYMIYTSGSTGKPKGVVVTHENLRAFMAWLPAELELKPGEAVAQHASFSFDASVCDLYSSLASGAALHILSSELRKDLDGLAKYIEEHHIVGSTLSTQLGMELLNSCEVKMRYMVLGGEKLKQVRRTSVRLYNGYGPTEFTVCSSHHIVDQEKDGENIPIGRPVPNSVSLILDACGNILPRGMAGELCLSGAQLSSGYWHRPELTEKVFVPCRALGGAMIYRTGDLARWNEDGELEYLGRIDNQVKLRGFRIEMGEIEAALSKFDGITSAVAEVKTVNGTQHLCAYYVADTPIEEDALKSELSKSLTEYMIPDVFMRLESLPLTPGGKVDRKALPVPELKADEIVPPRTERERQLFAVVSDELGTDQFGVTTNLLSMGLTSIRAIRLSMVIKNRLGLSISTGDILSRPRIRDWQESVSETIEVAELREYYPLTDNQLGIYIDWERHRDGLQYNVPSAMKFIGADADRMATALREVISNHPSLKTRIVQVEEDVMQRRRDDAEIPVLFEHHEEEPSAAFFQSRVRPFNLLEDDLARFEVYQTETAAYLFYDIHHIIFDGGAANVLLSDLAKILSGMVPGSEKVTAFDYALYYEKWKESDSYGEYEKYFDDLVSGTEPLMFPSGQSNQSSQGKAASVTVSVPLEKIRSFCRGSGITENAYFATVVTQVLHRITREETIQIATISNGRSMEQLSDTIGMFVQTLPLVSRSVRGSVIDMLRDMQSQIVETVRRDKYPFVQLSQRYGVKPNIIYVYQGDLLNMDSSSSAYSFETIQLSLDTVKMPLSINVLPHGGAYTVHMEYDTGMCSAADMELFGKALSSFAISLAEHSASDEISSTGLAAPSEVEPLIVLGTGVKLGYDSRETFVDMFLRNVSAAPDAVAVVDFCSSLTYSELDRASDALASRLVSEEVQAGDFVAVKMPRVKEFVVAVLGIWKAGAAYVPVDPEYPSERISYMLEDSGAKVVIDSRYCDSIAGGNTKPLDLARPENPAYMIYTSGSTGKPKGVVVTHENLRAFMAWLPEELELKPGEAVAQHASFSFDASVCDLYSSLSSGAVLHILSSELRKDLDGLAKYIEEHHIVGSTLSTQLGMELLNSCEVKMRYMVLGGEKLKQVRRTSVRLYNGYGPTEFTVWSSHHIVDQEKDGENIPIGRPVPNSVSLILDACGNILPRGMAGELCLSGAQLSGGYWHRPELTEKVFVPCRALGGAMIYRTGDLARWNEDGELEYLGRIDNQVKLRGFRIEMGEIEAALSKFDGITSAVAEVKTVNGTQHLCAYYVSDAWIDESALESELSKSLTEYMVPDVYVRLESMPLTPNGKVDRKALPLPELKEVGYVAPETEQEKIICTIFGEILGIPEYGATQDFFKSGGTSLICIKAVAGLQREKLDVVYGDIFKYKTPRALADFISGKEGKDDAAINIFDFGDFDYTAIDSLLSKTPDTIPSDFTLQSLGTVLLTGVTGFLGIHVLCSIMEMTDSKVLVLIRPRPGMSCEERLNSVWIYYIGFSLELYRNRISYIEGDITDVTLEDKLSSSHYDTVINCAAYVRHFAADDIMDRINVQGVRNLIECCAGCGARLVHI